MWILVSVLLTWIAMTHAPPVERYLARHALRAPEEQTLPGPSEGLKLCVVIPCLSEAARIETVLDSLPVGSARGAEVEVICVVNEGQGAAATVSKNNQATLEILAARADGVMRVLVLDRCSPGRALPIGEAGVGLARRMGMDLALSRLHRAGTIARSAIACLDGDSPVAPAYLDAILDTFDASDPPLGGVCNCLHPIPDDEQLAASILAYETWMRYFELGMRLTGSPFSYPTIGSCLVCSAEAYALADGMPPRQAGEDFYFAQKLIKLSRDRGLARLRNASVHPAARLSQRVVFGTGKAMLRCQAEGLDAFRRVESAQTFFELRDWFVSFEAGFEDPSAMERAAGLALRAFLDSERAWKNLDRIRANQPDARRFGLACHHWFDGLRCVRYAHAREPALGRQWAFDALAEVLEGLGLGGTTTGLDLPRPPDPERVLLQRWLELLRGLT
jgi:hypothetical protein